MRHSTLLPVDMRFIPVVLFLSSFPPSLREGGILISERDRYLRRGFRDHCAWSPSQLCDQTGSAGR